MRTNMIHVSLCMQVCVYVCVLERIVGTALGEWSLPCQDLVHACLVPLDYLHDLGH